jgi:ABC-2 type transport system permease protein
MSRRILDLTPFADVPRVPGEAFHDAPLLWLPAIDVVLSVVGLAAFRRRDLR